MVEFNSQLSPGSVLYTWIYCTKICQFHEGPMSLEIWGHRWQSYTWGRVSYQKLLIPQPDLPTLQIVIVAHIIDSFSFSQCAITSPVIHIFPVQGHIINPWSSYSRIQSWAYLWNTIFSEAHDPSLSSTLIMVTRINHRTNGFSESSFWIIKVFSL